MDLVRFMTSLNEEIVFGEEDPEVVVDRYFTPDIVQYADGLQLDRTKLIEHIPPTRKNLTSFRFDLHEVVEDGDRIAARYTLHAEMRKGRVMEIDTHMFGEHDPGGRFRRQHLLTRTVAQE